MLTQCKERNKKLRNLKIERIIHLKTQRKTFVKNQMRDIKISALMSNEIHYSWNFSKLNEHVSEFINSQFQFLWGNTRRIVRICEIWLRYCAILAILLVKLIFLGIYFRKTTKYGVVGELANKLHIGLKNACNLENTTSGRSYDRVSVNVSNCFFIRSLMYNDHGGVVFISSMSDSLSVSNSMFIQCSCNNYGGAIYFYGKGSEIKMICAFNCSALFCHFAYLVVSNYNFVDYLSISLCSNVEQGQAPLRIESGNQRLSFSNSSMNRANEISALYVYNPSVSSVYSYCTFSNNNVSSNTCIMMNFLSGTFDMVNVVHNNSPESNGVIYQNNGYYNFNSCILKSNNDILFVVSAGYITVTNSFISHTGTVVSGSVTTSNNNTYIDISTYLISFFSSIFCPVDSTFQQFLMPSPPRSYDNACEITLSNHYYEIATVYGVLFFFAEF